MPEYYLAPSLVRLRARVNELWPARDRSSDGWIGDAAHSARKSDHNPDWDAPGARRGIVRALDIDEDGIDADRLLHELVGHPAAEYVIYERWIYSRVRNFKPKAYTGANAHEHHLHVSISHTVAAEQWDGLWLPNPRPAEPADPLEDLMALDPAAREKLIDDIAERVWRRKVGLYGVDKNADGKTDPPVDAAVALAGGYSEGVHQTDRLTRIEAQLDELLTAQQPTAPPAGA